MTTYLIKLVKLSGWLFVTIFRTMCICIRYIRHLHLDDCYETCLAEMESPTIRKVRSCFGEAENKCLVLFKSVWHHCLLSLKWLQWRLHTTLSTVSLAISSQSTWARLSPNSFLCFTGNLVRVVVAVRFSRSYI